MLVLKKIWLFIKKHWAVLLLIIGAGVALFMGKKPVNFIDDYLKIKKLHDDELKKVQDAMQDDAKTKQDAQVEHDKNVIAINADAQNKNDAINTSIVDAEKKVVADAGGDPNKLATALTDEFGFKVIQPKDE